MSIFEDIYTATMSNANREVLVGISRDLAEGHEFSDERLDDLVEILAADSVEYDEEAEQITILMENEHLSGTITITAKMLDLSQFGD